MHMYQFKVKWYDEEEIQDCCECGLTCGTTYKEAVEKLEKWYGADNITDLFLTQVDEIWTSEELKSTDFTI